MIVRRSEREYLFEFMELAPMQSAVMQCKGRLIRTFPGTAVSLTPDKVMEDNFLEPFLDTIEKLDREAPEEIRPQVRKAKQQVSEIRDTNDPSFITKFVTQILLGIGERAKVGVLHKHTRDDVLWKDCLLPWRRAPLWLLLRVTLQSHTMAVNAERPHLEYKCFMLYMFSKLWSACLDACLSSDYLYPVAAKISRRTFKLSNLNETPWLKTVLASVESNMTKIEHAWLTLEQECNPLGAPLEWTLSEAACRRDCELKLKDYHDYVEVSKIHPDSTGSEHSNQSITATRAAFKASSLPRIGPFAASFGTEALANLLDFEAWVMENLDDWTQNNLFDHSSCQKLAQVTRDYTSAVAPLYKGDPLLISTMILTAMELLISVDKMATNQYPLLRDYGLGISVDLFEPLLLPFRAQMQRLCCIERYLISREESVVSSYVPIFGVQAHKTSLAVRFFDSSPELQHLRAKIDDDAHRERTAKLGELQEKRTLYNKKKSQASRLNCQYSSFLNKRGRWVSNHEKNCAKCTLNKEADGMSILVHEWPLPMTDIAVKVATFELKMPTAIFEWRETLYHMLRSVLRNEKASCVRASNVYTLESYAGLAKYRDPLSGRVKPSSQTKSFLVAHYRSKLISGSSSDSVCVNNGLSYELYDDEEHQWTRDIPKAYSVRPKCTFELPPGPYDGLHFAIANTTHSPNTIIALQGHHSPELTSDECYYFGTLRSGHLLQWRNIAIQLRSRILNFHHQAVQLLMLQAIWQAGPPGGASLCRSSHEDLEEEQFSKDLVDALHEAFDVVEENWQGTVAARTFSAIASRLLSLSPHAQVHEVCIRYLGRIRRATCAWMHQLKGDLRKVVNEAQELELTQRLLEVALTCHLTFDLDVCWLQRLLQEAKNVTILIECLMIIYDRRPTEGTSQTQHLSALLQRSQRLSHRSEDTLRRQILQEPEIMDNAIQQIWVGYARGCKWSSLGVLSTRQSQWITTRTSINSVPVHFNMLSGSLLVDSRPLTRLPPAYESHDDFRRLFGQVIFAHLHDILVP